MAEQNTNERTHALMPDGETVLAARQSGLYRLFGNGESKNLFADWDLGQDLPALAIGKMTGQILVGSQGGIALSNDGGDSWAFKPFRAPPPLVTCLALDENSLLAGTYEDGVFRSSDSGQTWQAVNHGLFDHCIFCLEQAGDGVVFAGASSGLYRSDNGGRLWHDVAMPAGDESVLSLALAEGVIYAGTEQYGLLMSADDGANWRAIATPGGAVEQILISNGGGIAIQIDDALHISRDGGENWRALVESDIECLAQEGNTLLLALADGSIQRLTI